MRAPVKTLFSALLACMYIPLGCFGSGVRATNNLSAWSIHGCLDESIEGRLTPLAVLFFAQYATLDM